MIGTENNTSESTKTLHLIFTLGVPGIGKSSLINTLRRASQAIPKMAVEVLTADEVRSAILAQEYQARSLQVENLSQEEIFKIEVESAGKIKTAFNEEVSNRLQKLSKVGSTLSLFFLDKNYCSAALVNHVNDEASKFFTGYNIERTLMVPDKTKSEDTENLKFGPFRFQTILVGLVRAINRKNHITMHYGNKHALLSFIGSLTSQVADSPSNRFPQPAYKWLEVDYYDKSLLVPDTIEGNLSISSLKELLMSLVTKKKELCEEIFSQLVAVSAKLSHIAGFHEITDEEGLEILRKEFSASPVK